jgi:NAD(P)-dependent dehydrogenase (short-subunit alcohol dehydrogenase family)
MPLQSRCVTLHPTAAPREGLRVLVIDRSVEEAEALCARLREEGHVAEPACYADDLVQMVDALSPQAVAIRMRLGSGGKSARTRVQRAFPHLFVVTFNAATAASVGERLPRRWTDLYDLGAAKMPSLASS